MRTYCPTCACLLLFDCHPAVAHPLSVVVVVVTVVVDGISDVYKWFDIDFDHFGRTSCPEPKKQLDWPQTQVQGRGGEPRPPQLARVTTHTNPACVVVCCV